MVFHKLLKLNVLIFREWCRSWEKGLHKGVEMEHLQDVVMVSGVCEASGCMIDKRTL